MEKLLDELQQKINTCDHHLHILQEIIATIREEGPQHSMDYLLQHRVNISRDRQHYVQFFHDLEDLKQ